MGIIANGEYRPREDLLARVATLATTFWAIPVLLAVVWGAFAVCNAVMNPRSSAMAYGFNVILTFIAILVFIGQCAYVLVTGVRRCDNLDTAGMKPLKLAFLLSLTLALGAGGLPLIAMLSPRLGIFAGLFFTAGLLLSCGWLATTAIFIGRYRKQGLRLFVGSPVALFWPLWIFMVAWSCTTGRGCL
jgi:hypothetical protein